MTDHPTATDYRNRAERAEAEAREAWAEADKLAKALEAMQGHLLNLRIGLCAGGTKRAAVRAADTADNCIKQALAEYNGRRLA